MIAACVLVRIEDAAGQGDAFGTDLDAPIWHLINVHEIADETARQVVHLKPDALAVVLQGQILGDIAFVPKAKDLGEAIRFYVQGAVWPEPLQTWRCRSRKPTRSALPSSMPERPAIRSSFTRRSCSVRFARSTRPLACEELAQMISMFSSARIASCPSCVRWAWERGTLSVYRCRKRPGGHV